METVSYARQLPVAGRFEVLVAGGGVAGCAAALTLAREGKNVLLVEKSNILGGLATLGLVNYFEPLCNGCGRQIMRGMVDEFFKLAIRYGFDDVPEVWKGGVFHGGSGKRFHTRFSPYIFALTLAETLSAAGVHILYDTVVTDLVMDGAMIRGAVLANKSGLTLAEASEFIDVTGDADLLTFAGVPTADGENYLCMGGRTVTLEGCRRAAESGNILSVFSGVHGGCGNQFGGGHPEGMPTFDGISAEQVTDFILKNQLLMLENLRGDDRMGRELVTIPLMPQFRTTRRIVGEYTITDADLFVHHGDSVGVMNDNLVKVNLYEIPFGTLVNRRAPNLITAGRSASAEGRLWGILRIIPSAIVTGQAAGFAAAQALSGDRSVCEPDLRALQAGMEACGGLVHFEDAWKDDPIATSEKK